MAYSRRLFLKHAAAGTLGLLAADWLYANPYQKIPSLKPKGMPVRITGAIKAYGKGLSGIGLTDGASVVKTDKNGLYELLTDSNRPFVHLSMPSGYEMPTNSSGTAKFYQRINATQGKMNASWDLKKANQDDNKHGFLVMSDPQTLDMNDMRRFQNETATDARELLKNYNTPFFNISCGDILFDDLSLYPEYEKAVQIMGIPSFQVVGNHDLDTVASTSNENSVATFQQFFGPNYYSFNKGEIHYVVLDDVFWHGNGYMGYLDQTQLDWLQADLALVEKGKTVVVFMHIPIFTEQFQRNGLTKPTNNTYLVVNRQSFYRLMEGYKTHVICGHMHFSEYIYDGGVSIHEAGAACGAWWTGDICEDGTPNGYGIYEVNGSTFYQQYKSTGKPLEHQLRLYKQGEDKLAPDEIIANVWNANRDWKVFWYENGMKKGLMAQRVGHDPLSVKMHLGDKLPQRHTWVEPQKTGHLYYAPAAKDASNVMVEAIAPNGKIYTQKL